jgi:hypothetical protein
MDKAEASWQLTGSASIFVGKLLVFQSGEQCTLLTFFILFPVEPKQGTAVQTAV